MVGDNISKPVDEVLQDKELVGLITQTGGHYTFEIPEVKSEMQKMFANLEAAGVNPHKITIEMIKRSISRYVECFNLAGLTGKIMKFI